MLRYIELTGFDRSVQVQDLVQIIAQRPWARAVFGIVLQASRIRRHPPAPPAFRSRNPDWEQILEAHERGLRLACHLSGPILLGALLRGQLPDLRHEAGLSPFSILQLNTTARARPFPSEVGGSRRTYTSYATLVADLLHHGELRIERALAQLPPQLEIVIQQLVGSDPVPHPALIALLQRCAGTGRPTRLLIDTSGGRGHSTPQRWPAPSTLRSGLGPGDVGYAGGLRPDNIDTALERLQHLLAPRETTWLSLETGVRRTDPGDAPQRSRFDPAAVALLLDRARPAFASREIPPARRSSPAPRLQDP